MDDDANVSVVGFTDQVIKVRERSIERINCRVIRNVVAKIHQGRGIHGAYPDCIYAEVAKVIQAGSYPIDVTNPIAVRILKAPRIDLIDDHVFLPGVLPFGFDSGLRRRGWGVLPAKLP